MKEKKIKKQQLFNMRERDRDVIFKESKKEIFLPFFKIKIENSKFRKPP
jgi:hypothetical protein